MNNYKTSTCDFTFINLDKPSFRVLRNFDKLSEKHLRRVLNDLFYYLGCDTELGFFFLILTKIDTLKYVNLLKDTFGNFCEAFPCTSRQFLLSILFAEFMALGHVYIAFGCHLSF